jgi:hypothetical protein
MCHHAPCTLLHWCVTLHAPHTMVFGWVLGLERGFVCLNLCHHVLVRWPHAGWHPCWLMCHHAPCTLLHWCVTLHAPHTMVFGWVLGLERGLSVSTCVPMFQLGGPMHGGTHVGCCVTMHLATCVCMYVCVCVCPSALMCVFACVGVYKFGMCVGVGV